MNRLVLSLIWILLSTANVYAQDVRYQVDVLPDSTKGETVSSLHANIQQAVDQALPLLWQQLLPPEEVDAMPQDIHGVRFLQRAIPTASGVTVIFDEKRINKFLSDLKTAQTESTSEQPNGVAQTPNAPVHTGLMLSLTIIAGPALARPPGQSKAILQESSS